MGSFPGVGPLLTTRPALNNAVGYAIAFLCALASSSLLTWYTRRKATQLGYVSVPSTPRDVHASPIPRLGGVAIFVSIVVLLFACSWLDFLPFDRAEISNGALLKILAPATLVFFAGLYDDVRGLRPRAKLGIEVIAAATVYMLGLRIERINVGPYSGVQLHGVISFVLTMAWILVITNAFNLIDGLDGLAAGSTIFSTLVLFVVAVRYDKELMGLVAVIVAGAAIGFLRYNFNPATIFLGDSGSLFIGFVLSVTAMATSVKSPTMITVTIPIACFGVPILDTAITVFRRTKNRKHLFVADRDHIHHRLIRRGLTHREAVVALYCACAAFSLVGLFMMEGGAPTAAVLFVLAFGVWLAVRGLGVAGIAKLVKAATIGAGNEGAALIGSEGPRGIAYGGEEYAAASTSPKPPAKVSGPPHDVRGLHF